ncbi:MAG: L-threonylcarbamoyladenylate synthase [Methylophilaceae bacterium]|jgi:tRNA threonylcarbamoyl adenosine modification protein (Sua5/YciO/YrdC/YwlC family)|nr:L-threonylcarbamoyladenylate synthase [Methylophilaceae bacterium]MDG1452825.1 L-threonylcarbamoyladenylate synthase [Methylophilaceae bacterium]
MAQYFVIHAENPQARLIKHTVEILRDGGIIAYPTDSSYAFGCMLGNKEAQNRIRQIRQVDDKQLFTLVCSNLSELATYAKVDNAQFRLLKANTPGAYSFILNATKEVPKRLQHPKRSAVGIRVPNHQVVQAILDELGEPMLSMTLQIGEEEPMNIAWEIRDKLERQLDLVIDSEIHHIGFTTVIDLTEQTPQLIRQGVADASPFGL